MVDQLEFQPTEEDLKHLREWIAKSPHIIQDYDDKVLSAFVRGCKGRLQKTKQVLEGFNSLGLRCPQIMKNYDPLDQRLVNHFSETLMFTLPKKTQNGSIVLMSVRNDFEDNKSDPYKFQIAEFVRYWLLSLYVKFWRNDFGPGKWILVGDCKKSEFAHFRDFTPPVLRQCWSMILKSMPVRIEAIHMLNAPPFVEKLFNILKSMVKKKISERIYLHSTMDTFYEKIPKEILPKEFGGKEDSVMILHDRWYETVKSYRKEFLEEEAKMRRLDPLRPKTDDEQEMVGSFKALNVD